ncbi:cyclic nucleotide-binding domain-containing protein [Spirochaeta dissipatitropha]
MPRPVSYKANSIIYFQGDLSDKVFVLREGKVSVTSRDIETGKQLQEMIRTGEFFGVKSALGRYPREENAISVSDCVLLVFSVQEFEDFAARNPRVVMQMLKVFSNQLRRIHIKVRGRLAFDDQLGPELGILRTADYFYDKRRLKQASYAYQRYLDMFPNGKYAAQAREGLAGCGNYSERITASAGSEPREQEPELDSTAKQYYQALSIFGRGDYKEALAVFDDLSQQDSDSEYKSSSLIEVGRCYYYLKDYTEAVKHLSRIAQQMPNLPEMEKALFYIARSYAALGNTDKAKAFFDRILTLKGIDEEFKHKVKNEMRKMEGKI